MDEIEGVDVVYEDGRVQFKVSRTLSDYSQGFILTSYIPQTRSKKM